jgi:hypothetical protein
MLYCICIHIYTSRVLSAPIIDDRSEEYTSTSQELLFLSIYNDREVRKERKKKKKSYSKYLKHKKASQQMFLRLACYIHIRKKLAVNNTIKHSLHPVRPPVAPVAWMREMASDSVVQVITVPDLLTRGRAAQMVPVAQGLLTNLPPTHWAKPFWTQA